MILSSGRTRVASLLFPVLFCCCSLLAQKKETKKPSETLRGPVYGHATLLKRSQARPATYKPVPEIDIAELQKAREDALAKGLGRREGIRVLHPNRTPPARPVLPPARRTARALNPSLVLASYSGPQAAPIPEGLLNAAQVFAGDADGEAPPGPILAVGTHFIVQMDNFGATFFPRIAHGSPAQQAASQMCLAAPLLPEGCQGFMFTTTKPHFCDPWIIFDPTTQRWFASIVQFDSDSSDNPTSSDVLLAFTSSEDPTQATSWTTLVISSANFLQDQPKLAVGADKVEMTWENVSQNNAQIEVIEKEEVLNGAALAAVTSFQDGVGILDCLKGLVPARMFSVATNTMFALSTKTNCGDNVIRVYTITGTPVANNVNVQVTSVSLKASFTVPQQPTDGGTNEPVDTGDARLLSAVWQNEELFATGADGCIPPNDNAPRSCARIYEISTAGSQPTLVDDFDIVGDQSPDYVFHPALAVDGSGNIIGVFQESPGPPLLGLNVVPFAIAAGSENDVMSGSIFVGPYPLGCFSPKHNAERSGDYSGAQLDPLYPDVVWLTGQLSGGAGTAGSSGACSWQTVIGSFTLGSQQASISNLSFTANGYGPVVNIAGAGFGSWQASSAVEWCEFVGASPAMEIQNVTQNWWAGQPGDAFGVAFALWQTAQPQNVVQVCDFPNWNGASPATLQVGDTLAVTVASSDGFLATATGTVPSFAAITLDPPPPPSVAAGQAFTVSGQVVNANGYFATHATVSVMGAGGNSTATDGGGSFSLPVTAPWINGQWPLGLTASTGATLTVNIPVVPVTAVTGTSPDHSPVCSQTPVKITGTDFVQGFPGSTGIDFGTSPAVGGVNVTSNTTLTTTSPVSPLSGTTSCPGVTQPRGAGPVPVIATLLGTQSVGGTEFSYYVANAPLLGAPGDTSTCGKTWVVATVWDGNGQPVINGNATVTFQAAPGATTSFSPGVGPGQSAPIPTDNYGVAKALLTSQVGTVVITASTASGSDQITTDFVPSYCGLPYATALPNTEGIPPLSGPNPLYFGNVHGDQGLLVNPDTNPQVPGFYQHVSFVEQEGFDTSVLRSTLRGYILPTAEAVSMQKKYSRVAIGAGSQSGHVIAEFVGPVLVLQGGEELQRQRTRGNGKPKSPQFRITLPFGTSKVTPGEELTPVWLDASSGPPHWTTASLSNLGVKEGLVSAMTNHVGTFSVIRIVSAIESPKTVGSKDKPNQR